MNTTKIVSSGVDHPENIVTTDSLVEAANMMKFGFQPDSVSRMLGITHVRQADIGTMPSDLAARASAKALKKAGIAAGDIDLVLFCGIDRDVSEPATAIITAEKLGIRPSVAFDIANACAGLPTGLWTAKSFLQSGAFKNALVCTGELTSEKIRKVTHNFNAGHWGQEKADHLIGAFSCGDAGAAMILSTEGNGVEIIGEYGKTKPEDFALCVYGGFGAEHDKDIQASMHMREICNSTIDLVRSMAPEFYDAIQWTADEVKYLLQHQVGKSPYNITTKLFNVALETSPSIYKELGNLTSASIPVCYENCDWEAGDKGLISSTGSGVCAMQFALEA